MARSIFVCGEITDSLVSALTPEILKLRNDGEKPITVFINSPGGSIQCLDYIFSLLTARTPSVRRPRIITVAVGTSASAAATLLSLGDYAICYPKSYIHFHGSRYGLAEDVTMESASSMASQLDAKNKAIALQLAESGATRLAFHYATLKDEFKDVPVNEAASEIERFANCLERRLSSRSGRIVKQAMERWRYISDLYDKIVRPTLSVGKKDIEFEAEILTRIIKRHVESHLSEPWALDDGGVSEIVSDYLLLRDYDTGSHGQLYHRILDTYASAFFDHAEATQIFDSINNPPDHVRQMILQRTRDVIRPFCYFAATVWQALQHDENPLTPEDAYWLGAIDEVYDSGLPCTRQIAEAESEQPDLPISSGGAPPSHPPKDTT